MVSTCCSCRTSALRTFVRSVAQVHLPYDNLAKAAPWHETRRHLHQRGTAQWSAVRTLPYRSINTLAEGSRSSATEDTDSTTQADMSTAAADLEISGDEQTYDGAKGHADVERITVEEIEAEQRAQEANRLRIKAERAKARDQQKKELAKQKEEEKMKREKERLKARPDWAAQKAALKKKFPEGWRPRKKLSPDALNGIRALHKQFPDTYTTDVLANKFEVSPEAIRRILRSKWEATPEEEEDRERRWHNRGVNIWQHYAAIGKKPPAKWREAGVAYQPTRRGGRDREEPDRDLVGGQYEPVQGDDEADLEQIKRFKRQQKLARELL